MASPSMKLFQQLSRYNDERDMAKELLSQHSSWLQNFRSQMNSAGLLKGLQTATGRQAEVTRQPLGTHNANVAAAKHPSAKGGAGGVRVQLDGSRELVISVEDILARS